MDSSSDDSDDFPPSSAPKQCAQAGHDEAATASNSDRSDPTSELRQLSRPIQTPSFDTSVFTPLLLKTYQRPKNNHECGVFLSLSLCSNHSMRFGTARYTETKILGIGPYSIVDEVRDSETGRIFARKTVHHTNQRTYRALKEEVEIMKKLIHPHIVRFIGTYTADHSLSILMIPSADFDLAYLLGNHYGTVNTETVIQ